MLQFNSMATSEDIARDSLTHGYDTVFEEVGPGDSVPLNEDGYQAVLQACCIEEMEKFARRVVKELGFVICSEGIFAGIIGYHTCGAEGEQSYAKLVEHINSGTNEPCPWVGEDGNCPEVDLTACGTYPDNFHRRRACGSTTSLPYTTIVESTTEAPSSTTAYPTTLATTTAETTTKAPTSTTAPTTTLATTTAETTTEAPTSTLAPTTTAATTTAKTTTEAPASTTTSHGGTCSTDAADWIVAADASNSVSKKGWDAQVEFLAKTVEVIL